jgi:hypothetical protein
MLEVDELQRADPTPPGDSPKDPEVARVIGRASVVLLSSHFERYIYSLNEEAIELLNEGEIIGKMLPELLRLLHTQTVIDELFSTQWQHRGPKLSEFVVDEAWLWGGAVAGELKHRRLVEWMKSPSPPNLERYFRYWGVRNIFESITRSTHTRSDLWLRIDELVGKRNNIAHGDLATEATHTDISAYQDAAMTFSERTDRLLGQTIGRLLGRRLGW